MSAQSHRPTVATPFHSAKKKLKITEILKFLAGFNFSVYGFRNNDTAEGVGVNRRARIETPDIYTDLQRRLITRQFLPGQKLKPAELAGEYGVSANTIRDVLMRLSLGGLVEFKDQRGFRASQASLEKRRDITRFRILLEQEGARLSMRLGGLEWEAQLSAAHHKLRHIESQIADAENPEPNMGLWSDAEIDFHRVLISACESEILIETYARVYAQFRQQMVAVERDFGSNYFHAIIHEHQQILDAALARNIEECRQAIYDHLKRNL